MTSPPPPLKTLQKRKAFFLKEGSFIVLICEQSQVVPTGLPLEPVQQSANTTSYHPQIKCGRDQVCL